MDNKQWNTSVNKIGRLTLIFAILLSYGPFLYLAVVHNVIPPIDVKIVGIFGIIAAFGVVWVVEPVSFFPVLGTAGTYMAFLAGSIGQMRVPAAKVAKDVAEVDDNTQEAEIVAICGIAGSIYLNLVVVLATALAGTLILAAMPEVVINAITTYILAAIFGAVLAMMAKGRFVIAVPVFLFAVAFNFVASLGILPLFIAQLGMLFSVLFGIGTARVFYKRGIVK